MTMTMTMAKLGIELMRHGIDGIYEAYTILASGVIGTRWRCSTDRFRWAAEAIRHLASDMLPEGEAGNFGDRIWTEFA